MNPQQLQARYGVSAGGNFYVKDTIGTPHPYCITPKHVVVASDHFCGRLGEDAIQAAEKGGARCGMSGCRLKYAEHETALLVSCKVELKGQDGDINGELKAYLLACKPLCEEDGYVGFAFLKEEE